MFQYYQAIHSMWMKRVIVRAYEVLYYKKIPNYVFATNSMWGRV